MPFCNSTVSVINLGDAFTIPDLENTGLAPYESTRFRDAYRIPLDSGEAWVFQYGIIVFWAVSDDEQQLLIQRVTPHIELEAKKRSREVFQFAMNTEQLSIRADLIVLPGDDHLLRLAVSHALAQSTQLIVFESMAQENISATAHIPAALAEKGKIPLRRRELARIRGRLFATKSDIILHYGLLDTPEFFWEYPELEATYIVVARYLDIKSRVEVLSQKLGTIHELLEMLADEQNHQHSSFLEWIIIVLIGFEIVMAAFH
ncbi:MAG TPA: sad1-interacting factor 2 [Spongiibacteraceae bacterium]|nr:sad1-interacting factor 2 [Spongiibacteraceae bacterium]HCS28517.1 sad1-interacting factor 2 [Spongiibacteraceae bacterium]|tara:strand:+ start:122 stop:901 length:780 start_codon:yes stop_codon:yes gene_type:complete